MNVVMCFVCMYENTTIKAVEFILRSREEE
jgi:hypothetical protein